MFEDSTFESTGRIHTRSRRWMIAVFLCNTSILLALILIPLINPEALPRQFITFLMEAPAPPQPQQPQPKPTVQTARPARQMDYDVLVAPSRIPPHILYVDSPEPPVDNSIASWEPTSTTPGGLPFGKPAATVVRPENRAPIRVSTKVEEGLLIRKTVPVYPAIAKAAGVGGTVRLAATISRNGTIENLRVTGGPAMLQQAALDAVKTWVYRPYLLDGQPVEVETTVDVVFMLSK
jgi:protein TonB